MQAIFSENLLSHYTSEFRLSSVTNIRSTTLLIKGLIEELESGKIESLKEEEIKSRFINAFFGDILGFNYGNSNKWQIKDEKKSLVDRTKPDTALGYFFVGGIGDDVRAVIEIKDAKTDLDKKQNRPVKQTPVEQAFGYVAKMGGKCKWVIVSNIKETRFYPSLDSSKYQVFFLKDLIHESKLKELLFLFHKDRFINEQNQSSTDKLFEQAKAISLKCDKPIHIIDKIYNSLKRFEGFGFIDPDYIATITPFNILKDHVWHYYNRNLFTINSKIFELIKEINIEDGEVILTDNLKSDILSSNVVEAKYKIEWSFTFLNNCLIDEISAIKDYQQIAENNKRTIGFTYKYHFNFKENEEGITKSIRIKKDKTCDCLICNYRSLDFNKFLSKLKTGSGNEFCNNAEYAYGNYLAATNNFKTTYNIYKAIEKEVKNKQDCGVHYFLTKMNIKLLHNLVSDYHFDDRQEIMNDIKSVDLNKVIYDEIEFDVDNEVRDYLIDVKENVLIYKLQDEIDEICININKLKLLYDKGGKQEAGPNLPYNLGNKYFILYSHINRNYIIYNAFSRYRSLSEKVFIGLIISYQTPKIGLKTFNDFFLTEAILHISQSSLKEILKGIDVLKVDEGCIETILEKLKNFTSSYFNVGLFSDAYKNSLISEHLNNHRFKYNFREIFANLFTILSRLNISKEQFEYPKESLIKFLKIENELSWVDIEELSHFMSRKGDLFDGKELEEILNVAVTHDNYGMCKYDKLIEQISETLIEFHPTFRIENTKLVNAAILNCTSEDGNSVNFLHLVHLINICDINCRQILIGAFEKSLDENFNFYLYEELLRNTDYSYNSKNYFRLYTEYINMSRGDNTYEYGKNVFTDTNFIRYIILAYKREIEFDKNEFSLFTELNDFETWILNPLDFDYNKFNAKWLIDISYFKSIFNRLKHNEKIRFAIELELNKEYDPILSEIKYKYFSV